MNRSFSDLRELLKTFNHRTGMVYIIISKILIELCKFILNPQSIIDIKNPTGSIVEHKGYILHTRSEIHRANVGLMNVVYVEVEDQQNYLG